MATHEYEALIHRYLDGELEASQVLKVEEHLRSSPESRAYLEGLRGLDDCLTDALGSLPHPGPELEAAVSIRLRQAAGRSVPPLRHLDLARRKLHAIRIAAAVLVAALILQVGLLVFGGASDDAGSEAVDDLRRQVARLELENEHLRSRAPTGFGPRIAPLDPTIRRPVTAPAAGNQSPPEIKAAEAATGPRPEKGKVFASIRDILSDFRRNGRWDLDRQAQIMRNLAGLGELSEKDFRELRHLFGQQDQYGPGQLFLAQVISRFFSHDPTAREFVYGKVATELDRLRRGGPGAMGDRVLRRAWTEGLAHARDRRSLDYLRELGLYDLDWVNRENAIGALAHIGTEDAVRRLGELAAAEKNAQLKEESLRHLYDLIYSDPTLGQGAARDLQRQMLEILEGELGSNYEHFDSMVLALQIVRALGGTTEDFLEMWRRRNLEEPGGDPRGGVPNGIPLPDPKKP